MKREKKVGESELDIFVFILFICVLLFGAERSYLGEVLGVLDAGVLLSNNLEVARAARAGGPSADGLLAPVV